MSDRLGDWICYPEFRPPPRCEFRMHEAIMVDFPEWWVGLPLPQARRRGCPGRGTPGERGNGPSRGVGRPRGCAYIYLEYEFFYYRYYRGTCWYHGTVGTTAVVLYLILIPYIPVVFFFIIWSDTILISTSREKPERLRACRARAHWQAPAEQSHNGLGSLQLSVFWKQS